jgi:tetratricopeptide (TPR) repeat protein
MQMNLTSWIEEIENTVLLGSDKQRALDLADQLALRIDPNLQPDLALRLLIRRFQADPNTPQAAAQLATAEAWARSEGLSVLGTHIQLLWCRKVALTAPEAVPKAIADTAIALAQEEPSLATAWRLAKAAIYPAESRALREETLTLLVSPAQDKERIDVHLELAASATAGADFGQAERHLEQAMHIAKKHDDVKYKGICASRIGLQWIVRGRTDAATPWLEQALAMSQLQEDDLQIVAHASILSAIWIERSELEKATTTADVLLVAGARRGNWFAVVDGHITRSTISLISGDTTAAIERLVRAVVRLRALIPAAAINLLKGRLAELRHQLGSDTFDDHYTAAVAAHQTH